MRKEQFFRAPESDAWELFRRAPVMHMAAVDPQGLPILRSLHGVVVNGAVAFHMGPVGEKATAIGRPVVLQVEEVVAEIPSYFLDPERACPATTLYRSAQIHGVLEAVTDPRSKAEALTALMEKMQPEGGYAPINPGDPRYTKAVASIAVCSVRPTRIDAKSKLAQNRTPAEREKLIEGLRKRGAPGDAAAIEAVVAANKCAPPEAGATAPRML